MSDFPSAVAVDPGLLPLCTCGAPAMAWTPGTDPETAAGLFMIGRGEAVHAWCLACWQAEFGGDAA